MDQREREPHPGRPDFREVILKGHIDGIAAAECERERISRQSVVTTHHRVGIHDGLDLERQIKGRSLIGLIIGQQGTENGRIEIENDHVPLHAIDLHREKIRAIPIQLNQRLRFKLFERGPQRYQIHGHVLPIERKGQGHRLAIRLLGRKEDRLICREAGDLSRGQILNDGWPRPIGNR